MDTENDTRLIQVMCHCPSCGLECDGLIERAARSACLLCPVCATRLSVLAISPQRWHAGEAARARLANCPLQWSIRIHVDHTEFTHLAFHRALCLHWAGEAGCGQASDDGCPGLETLQDFFDHTYRVLHCN